ncbi:hypothetical protein [uncultured Enterovirga sp.]|uniref:hypothetical protein n=1 Tax=uncultured Enterovirga sp. TaxID=2026352 RepID=UPI0035CBD71E
MSDPQILNTLRAKRVNLEKQLALLDVQVKAAQIALSHVSAVIQLYEQGDEPVQFPVHMDLNRLFRRGEMWTLAKAALEAAGRPLTTREIAIALVAAKGWNADDVPLRKALAYRLVQALTMQWQRGKVTSPGKRGGVRIWSAGSPS